MVSVVRIAHTGAPEVMNIEQVAAGVTISLRSCY